MLKQNEGIMRNIKSDLRYMGNGYNKEVFKLVPCGSRVLDVGCNTGYLGEKLIREKNCSVYGIDYSRDALNVAKQKLNKIKRVDLEKYNNEVSGKFDIIIFADILEHIRFPEKTLKIYKKLLAPNGKIVASIPNVANVKNRIFLMLGMWNYTPVGLLDETHLRFFTKKTIIDMLQRTGLKSEKVYFTVGCKFFVLRYFNILKKVRKILCGINPKLFALQFVIICTKNEGKK